MSLFHYKQIGVEEVKKQNKQRGLEITCCNDKRTKCFNFLLEHFGKLYVVTIEFGEPTDILSADMRVTDYIGYR